MYRILSIAVLLLLFGKYSYGQVVSIGQCPATTTVDDFDLGSYAGLWYQYGAYPFVFTLGTKCVYAIYGGIDDNTISVQNSAQNIITGKFTNIKGYAKVLGPGSLAVVFFPGQSQTMENYKVIGTDYTSYAVVYSCTQILIGRIEFLWILTRDRQPSQDVIDSAMSVISQNGISTQKLMITDQSNCPQAQ